MVFEINPSPVYRTLSSHSHDDVRNTETYTAALSHAPPDVVGSTDSYM